MSDAEDYWESIAEERDWERRHRPLDRGEAQVRENAYERHMDQMGAGS